jgi:hypothetical protein
MNIFSSSQKQQRRGIPKDTAPSLFSEKYRSKTLITEQS